MFKHIDYVMVMVSDMKRSVEFYRDKLGVPLKFGSSDWTEFQTGTSTLALHGGGIPQPRIQRRAPGKSHAGTCSIGFTVQDLQKTYNHLQSRGVKFVLSPTVRKDEGIELAVCLDPDGLSISFVEMQH